MRFQGKRAVVVGVGSVLGRGSAKKLHSEGAEVVVVDPSIEVATRIANEFPGVEPFEGALTSLDDAKRLAAHCEAKWGAVDILMNMTGYMEHWPHEEDSFEKMKEVILGNVMGGIAYTQAFEELLAKSGNGSIVHLGSIDGTLGNSNVPAYSAGKAGLAIITHMDAQRLGPKGIRVNCVATAMISHNGTGHDDLNRKTSDPGFGLRMTPLGRRPKAADMVGPLMFYASDDSSYVSGTILHVDGGRTAATPGTW